MAYRKMPYKDESLVEGSDQWIIMQQLAYGQLRLTDVQDLLDCGATKALRTLYSLRSFGHVQNAGHGMWELVPQSGTRLQT